MAPDTQPDAPAREPSARAVRSQRQLTEALTTLLATQEGSEITISALCTEAGVSRPTFYSHFDSVDEVAVAAVEDRFRRVAAEVPPGPDAPHRMLVAFLRQLEAERGPWQRTLTARAAFASSRDAVEEWFVDRLRERWPDASISAVRYAAAGLLGTVRAWLVDDDPGRSDADELADTLSALSERVLAPLP